MRRRRRRAGRGAVGAVVTVVLAAAAAACSGGTAAPAASTLPEPTALPSRPAADGVLTIGVLLPVTGAAATTARGLRNGIELAVAEINANGGVLGRAVRVRTADEGADPAATSLALDDLVANGADAVIGPLSARVAPLVAERATGAGAAVCHPATAARARSPRTRGTVVTTMPTVTSTGRALGRVLVETGARRVGVVAPADDYGDELADAVVAELREQGIDGRRAPYDARSPAVGELAARVAADRPDAVTVVGNVEPGAAVLAGLLAAGLRPPAVPVVLSDGFRQQELLGALGTDAALDGASVLVPVAEPAGQTGEAFRDAITAADPSGVRTWAYAAYAFDCVNLLAVGAQAAGTDDPVVFGPRIAETSRAGVSCTTVARCATLLAEGRNVDLVGASGPLDLDDAGNPLGGSFELHRFDATGRTRLLRLLNLR